MALADQVVIDNISPHLEEGEELRQFAYGVKQPSIWLIILGFVIGIIPGVIIVAVGTKEYYVALTDRRLLILRVRNMKRVLEGSAMQYDLGTVPPVHTSAGSIFAHMRIDDPEKPFVAKFHRLGMKDNRERVTAMGEALAAA